ncbi:MAG: hypothetical protein WBE47_18770, partial [Candidatus Acidiferrales bacterium]
LRGRSAMAALLIVPAMLVALAASSLAQEQTPPALPLQEMQRLSKLYVGTWSYTETYPKSSVAPNGGVNTGVYRSELGPGGNSIINHFHSKGPVGEFEGVMVMNWDPNEGAYKAYVFGDSFPAAVVQTGRWEGDALVYRYEFSAGATKYALRSATKFLEGGKFTSDEFSSTNGAAEILLVHTEAVKK